MFATFIAAGRLTANPAEGLKKITRDGEERAVCNFTLACDPDTATGETDFYDCVVWGKQAESLATYMEKGKAILIEGRPHKETWDKDGVKQYRTKITVNKIKFLERGKGKDTPAINEEEPPF